MSVFRVNLFPDFKWSDAVLAAADRDGLRIFQSAVRSAREDGQATFEVDGIQHQIVRQSGAADIELGSQTVVWRFDDVKLAEILDMIEPLIDIKGPGHQYIDDLNTPASTLLISVDEYV
ncbi:hypothetical protein [Mycobacterium lacus]|uniref:Uncharacterized protein n=1 Tax=Mycobacterium lacus TaxID=169765 RepID=A0A7I7NGG2_9MYCO|nr:hypothetical protein [Mycobacterium lacus]MCV7124677.1 hypothetical protein [Mycobacterium lacus]BBX95518.1 hypothetical protein MLAC_08120 [Mycobacterium lacus]